MRRPFVAANWKMHKTVEEAVAYAHDFAPRVEAVTDVDIVIAPPFLALPAFVEATDAGTSTGSRMAPSPAKSA